MKKNFRFQSGFSRWRRWNGLGLALTGVFLVLAGLRSIPEVPARPGPQRTADNFWASSGGPQGGDALAMVTNAGGFTFVGTQGGGVFRTSDNGATWTAASNGLTTTDIRALAANAAGDLFAGTFSGVFRSTDDGENWAAVNNGLDYPFIISLAVSPSGDIFAGTLEGGGVFRSTDNGESWTLMNNGLTNTYVYALDRQRRRRCLRRHLGERNLSLDR